MSLRMNLYGWRLRSFRETLGSKNSALYEAASEHLTQALPTEPALSKGRAWLRTLIENGFPLRQDRKPASEPADGGLLTMKLETEVHVFATYAMTRALAREDDLNLADKSSDWKHAAVRLLYEESVVCGFTRSKSCPPEYLSWLASLSSGSPLFGDDFRTDWSFYTVFTNEELAAMIPVLQVASDFRRSLPDHIPKESAKEMATELPANAREFVAELKRWFGQIQHAGQDAFVLWW